MKGTEVRKKMRFEIEIRPKQVFAGMIIAMIILLIGVVFVMVYQAGKDSATKVRYVRSEDVVEPVVVEIPVSVEPVRPVIKYEKKGECIMIRQVDENSSVMRCDLV